MSFEMALFVVTAPVTLIGLALLYNIKKTRECENVNFTTLIIFLFIPLFNWLILTITIQEIYIHTKRKEDCF